jgi:hypothetical protein
MLLQQDVTRALRACEAAGVKAQRIEIDSVTAGADSARNFR